MLMKKLLPKHSIKSMFLRRPHGRLLTWYTRSFNRSPMPRWDSGYDSPGQSKAKIKLEDAGYFSGLRAASESPLELKYHDRLMQSRSILTVTQAGQDLLGQHQYGPVDRGSDTDVEHTTDTNGDADHSLEEPDVPNNSKRCTPNPESKYGEGLDSGSPLPKVIGNRDQGLASRQAVLGKACSKSHHEELGDAYDAVLSRPTTVIGIPNSTLASDDLLNRMIGSAGSTISSILAANFMVTIRAGIRMVFACLLLECIELLGSGFELFANTVLVFVALRPALSALIPQDPELRLKDTTTTESNTTESHIPIDPMVDDIVFGHDLTYRLPDEQSGELATPNSVFLEPGPCYGRSAKPSMQTVPGMTPISNTPVRRLFEKEISHKMQSGQLHDDMFLSHDVGDQFNSCPLAQAFIDQEFRGCYSDERYEGAENFAMPGAFKEDKVYCDSQQFGEDEQQSGTASTEFVSLYTWPEWSVHVEGNTEDEENDSEFGLSISDLSSAESCGSSEYWSDEEEEDCIDTLSEGGCQCGKSAYDEHGRYIFDPWPGASSDSVSNVLKKTTKSLTCEKDEGPSTPSAKQQKYDSHYGIHKEAQGPTSIPRHYELTSLHSKSQHRAGSEPAEYFGYETLRDKHKNSPVSAKNQATGKADKLYQPFSNVPTSSKRSNAFDQDEGSTKPSPSKYQQGESGTRYQIWNSDAMKTTEFTFEYSLDARPRRVVEQCF